MKILNSIIFDTLLVCWQVTWMFAKWTS